MAGKPQPEISEKSLLGGVAESNDSTGNNYLVSHLQTHEQFFSPISIKKDAVSNLPGYEEGFAQLGEIGVFKGGATGPTANELNPYFSNIFNNTSTFLKNTDFIAVVHDVTNTDDEGNTTTGKPSDVNFRVAAERGDNPNNISNVRINALRGPLILSGWGFGIDDMPVPQSGAINAPYSDMDGLYAGAIKYPNKVRHHPDVGKDRRRWKTGPINLMWDDERKVWQGGLPVCCGIAITDIEAPNSPCNPTEFQIKLFRNTGDDSADSEGGSDFTGPITTALGEIVTVKNRDMSLEQDLIENAVFVICMKINYEWLPIWVGCPEESPTDTKCIPAEIFGVDP